jgi:major membrane immunogen (membrane-anchored lipoprotein)
MKSFKLNHLRRVLVVLLAGVVLLINTACSRADETKISKNTGYYESSAQHSNADYDKFGTNQSEKGGMNKYNDDSRYSRPEVQGKTQELIDNAKANLTDEYDPSAVEKASERTSRSFDRMNKEVSRGTKEGVGNVREGLVRTSKKLDRATQDASDAIQNKAYEASKTTKRAIEDAVDNIAD